MTKEELSRLIENVVQGKENVEALADALYPLFYPVELEGKTLIINIPISGTIEEKTLMRYYAYADILKGMGAKNVIFLERDCKLTDLSDKDLEKQKLRRV